MFIQLSRYQHRDLITSQPMAKKKKSQQDKAPRMSFRERFEQNVQKSIAKGNKWAKKAEKSNKVGLVFVFCIIAFFCIAAVFSKQSWFEKAGAVAVIAVFVIVWLFILLKWTPVFKEAKIVRGEKLIRYPVRTRAGHELRVRLLPKVLEMSAGLPVVSCFLVFFSLMLGLSVVACLVQLVIDLLRVPINWWRIPHLLFAMIFEGSLIVVMWRGYFWTRNYTKTERKLAHKPPKTTIEVSEHPLQIGREYEFC